MKTNSTVDMPAGIVQAAETADKEKATHPMVLVGIVLLMPLWLPAWGIYLVFEWWDLRRRPRGTCLTYHPAMKDFRPGD